MGIRRLLAGFAVVVVSAVLLIAGVSPPAVGATTRFQDPARDAVARWDLTGVRVGNYPERVYMKAHVRALRAGGTQIFVVFLSSLGSDVAYRATSVRRASGRIVSRLERSDSSGTSQVACEVRSHWRLRKNRIAIAFPQRCLDEPMLLRAYVAIGKGNGSSGDPADWTRTIAVPFG